MQNKLDEKISYIDWSEEPLSSDVIIINGDNNTWIFDVGASDEALDAIRSIEGHKNIILSHFHRDHIFNMKELLNDDDITLYVSKNTFKYTKAGEIVDKEVTFYDGVALKIIPLPSTHSKGCLILEVDGKYAFIADAIYPQYDDVSKTYNVQLLKSQIDILKGLDADKIYLSHDNKPFIDKNIIIAFLMSIYKRRKPGDTSIVLNKQE